MEKVLLKGNEAIALAAIKGGCDAFFGYPITPQNEIPEYLSKAMNDHGRVFVQAESEDAAIHMVYGAAGAGFRVMTSSSSPGIALKQEGISFLCGSELPCVIVNVMRGGPGLGGIQPSQADYFQVTRGGGNGDYRVISFAPENLQETVDLVTEAFGIADYYRNPVMIAVDGLIGQMMESVNINKPYQTKVFKKNWATRSGLPRNVINSLYLDPKQLEQHNLHLLEKYNEARKTLQRFEYVELEGAEVVLVAYGTMARICRSAIKQLKKLNIKVGLLRPISLWPFPEEAFASLSKNVKKIICCELSLGQMIDDVKIAVNGRVPVEFFGRTGGILPEPDEVVAKVLTEMEVNHE